jgi:mannose-6-phosphate isomerase-like protein (cupin superfamily)
MTEVFTINNEELAILCDFVGGWGAKWVTNVKTDKRRALDRLIANGFIEPAADSVTKYQHTEKTELLFWRDGIYDWIHYHSRTHEVLGIARGSAKAQFGGPKGRTVTLKAGDAAILPAGTPPGK